MPDAPRVRLVVERVVAGGDGLAREPSGRVVFVPGALPGEVVDVQLLGAKRDFARSTLVDVIEPSPHRVAAPCQHRTRGCGGCDWQHVEPTAQHLLKVEVVRDALRRTARIPDPDVAVGAAVSPWSYRTSMRFALDGDGRPALHRARSNDLVGLDSCPVAHPRLSAMLSSLRISGAAEVSLRVSASSGDASAWWTPSDAVAQGLGREVGTGELAAIVERVAGHDLRVSASSFFQSGPEAAELLVAAVRGVAGDALDSAGTVVDAYGGVGLFAATVVPPATQLVVVEGSASACADARVNLVGRNVSVDHTGVEQWRPVPADVVIADPSRHGLGAAAVERLVLTAAPTIVLISCDPVSLARDATLLRAAGYLLARCVVLDLFPQSHHVEVVTRFERQPTATFTPRHPATPSATYTSDA